jgi:hypothetical protein
MSVNPHSIDLPRFRGRAPGACRAGSAAFDAQLLQCWDGCCLLGCVVVDLVFAIVDLVRRAWLSTSRLR